MAKKKPMSEREKKRRREQRKRNREFEALGPAAKRVAIAKDVLDQLAAERYIATAGTYVETGVTVKPSQANAQVCDILDKATECNVCAIGSVFVSAVRLADKLTLNDMRFEFDSDWKTNKPEPTPFGDFDAGYLKQFFTKKQLNLMEACFEGVYCSGAGHAEVEDDDHHTARLWYDRANAVYEGDDFEGNRLRLIMKNIVRNNGEFIPEVVEVAR